jgi:hypothetical protein
MRTNTNLRTIITNLLGCAVLALLGCFVGGGTCGLLSKAFLPSHQAKELWVVLSAAVGALVGAIIGAAHVVADAINRLAEQQAGSRQERKGN